jgi:hypothetical protein
MGSCPHERPFLSALLVSDGQLSTGSVAVWHQAGLYSFCRDLHLMNCTSLARAGHGHPSRRASHRTLALTQTGVTESRLPLSESDSVFRHQISCKLGRSVRIITMPCILLQFRPFALAYSS